MAAEISESFKQFDNHSNNSSSLAFLDALHNDKNTTFSLAKPLRKDELDTSTYVFGDAAVKCDNILQTVAGL